jgi:ABC-type dipeptide/oligopeptide/nickel transport system ATPase component
MPQEGGHLSELKELLNIDEDGWILAVNWLLFSFYPKFPHPILVFCGEQGTGKSFTAKLLKSLIDPGKAPLNSKCG